MLATGWAGTSRLIEVEQQGPESIESGAERERQERLLPKCEQLYRKYRECPDWGKSGFEGFLERLGRMTKKICPFRAPVNCRRPG